MLRSITSDEIESLGLKLPWRGAPSLADVMPSVFKAMGAKPSGGSSVAAGKPVLPVAENSRVCVILVDGLGFHNLAERGGHAPFLRRAMPDAMELTTAYPSTTSACLGTFGTSVAPGVTGMLGYTVRKPNVGESTGVDALANLVQWTNMPPAEEWQQVPTAFELLTQAGKSVTSVGPAKFAGSGMTLASLRGGMYRSAESLPSRVDAVVDALRKPGLVYLYWGDVDKTGHHYGSNSWQWGDALEHADGEISRLVRSVPKGTTVVLTADHGMIDVDLNQRWDVAQDEALRAGVALIGGEPRAVHVYLKAGTSAQDAADRWSERLGSAAVVLTQTEAINLGIFGTVRKHTKSLIGDLVVAMTGNATVVDSATQTPMSLTLKGVHGSLTPAEMTVPFLQWA